MPSVTIGEYWVKWMEIIISRNIRKSKAEIVEEGLKSIKTRLDLELEEWLNYQKMKKEGEI